MLEVDTKKLFELFRDFYTLTVMQICLFDDAFNEVFRYPEKQCAFCALIRENPLINKKCVENDRNAFEKCTATKSRYTYRCHMGLIETATPILFDDNIVGYVMVGQIADSYNKFENILPKIEPYLNKDAERTQAIYESIPYLSEEKISAAIHIADACAGYLYIYKLVKMQSESLSQKINGYIQKNMDKRISVDMLCREFFTSRVELYGIFDNLFHTSVADYLKRQKVNYAKKLLTETRLPINKIASKCGFSDYNYFSKIFKKECGISSANFRNNPFNQ